MRAKKTLLDRDKKLFVSNPGYSLTSRGFFIFYTMKKREGSIQKDFIQQSFVTIPNSTIQDASLSWKARGILAFLLSMPYDWRTYKTSLHQFSENDGRDGTIAGFNELINAGYVLEEEDRDETTGHFSGVYYRVRQTPFTENPVTANPVPEKPLTVNPSLQNKQLTKNTETNTLSPEGSNLNLFQNQNEKQTPNPLPPSPVPAANAEPKENSAVVEFAEFWEAYGKKTGKIASEKLWHKLKPDERRKALDYIPAYHAKQSDPKYRKDPERYLKNKLWEDGVPMGAPLRTESPFMANVHSTPTTPEERVRQRAFSTEVTDRQY